VRRISPPFAAPADPIPASAGVGLRFPHHRTILAGEAGAAWFEVHPENYLGDGVLSGILEAVRRDFPISLHATGLSLGSAAGVDEDHLAAIAALARRIEPGLVSDHLSWCRAGGMHLPDLLPLPCTREALEIFARNVERVQTALRRPILVENPSLYLAFGQNEMREGEFLAALARKSGCGVLLDVNNVAVSAANLGEQPAARLHRMLDDLPQAVIGEIHLAGHAVRELAGGGRVHIDDHGSPVSGEVWDLYADTIRRIGPRPTLIERDTAIPAFAQLAREAGTANAVMARAGQARHAAAG
jgi:uncharacterized protein (UPF0276 family)